MYGSKPTLSAIKENVVSGVASGIRSEMGGRCSKTGSDVGVRNGCCKIPIFTGRDLGR
jgi:hypothetical protein